MNVTNLDDDEQFRNYLLLRARRIRTAGKLLVLAGLIVGIVLAIVHADLSAFVDRCFVVTTFLLLVVGGTLLRYSRPPTF